MGRHTHFRVWLRRRFRWLKHRRQARHLRAQIKTYEAIQGGADPADTHGTAW